MRKLRPAPPPASFYDDVEAFVRAAYLGKNEPVTAFLDKYGNEHVDVEDNNEYTALKSAAAEGHKETIMLLLKNGADINKGGEKCWTALMHAAQRGRKDIVELLLTNGADPKIKIFSFTTALTLAKASNHFDVAELIEQWPEIQKQRKENALADELARELAHITRTVMGGLTRPLPYKPFGGRRP